MWTEYTASASERGQRAGDVGLLALLAARSVDVLLTVEVATP